MQPKRLKGSGGTDDDMTCFFLGGLFGLYWFLIGKAGWCQVAASSRPFSGLTSRLTATLGVV